MINTLLFDLDGTIVEHGHVLLPPILDSWGHARPLDAIEAAVHESIQWIYSHVTDNSGNWTRDMQVEFYARTLSDLRIDDPSGMRSKELTAYFDSQPVPPLFDDVYPMLDALPHDGWRFGVITQRGNRGARKFLEAHQLDQTFEVIVAGDDGHGRKPTAAPFHAALQALASQPQRAIFVGDRIDDDCEGALGAGFGAAFLIDRDRRHVEEMVGRTDCHHLVNLVDLLSHLPEEPHSGS